MLHYKRMRHAHNNKSEIQVELRRLAKNKMSQSKCVENRCGDFVVLFVTIFEEYFADQYDRLIKKTEKPGKTATLVNDLIGLTTPGAEVFDNVAKAMSLLGAGLVRKLVYSVGARQNRSKTVSLTQQSLQYKRKAETLRNELIDAALKIFSSYECQFAVASTKNDPSGELAMTRIAQDAVCRVIHYYTEHDDEITQNSITQGLVKGNSKHYWNTLGWPKSHKGHNVLLGKQELNTKQLFETLGVIDGDYFYSNVHSKFPQDDNIAFRLSFDWESVSSNNNYNKLSKPPKQQYKYMSPELLEEIKTIEVSKIEDASQEGKYKKLLEELEEIAERNAKRMCTVIESNYDQINAYLNDIKKQVNDTFEQTKQIDLRTTEILQKTNRTEQTNLEILETSKRTEHMLQEVKNANEEIKDITQTLNAVGNNGENVQNPIRDWKRAIDSFTGRDIELDELHRKIHRNTPKNSLSSQITVITGLGGIGKTQLARKYTERNEGNYHDVLWLNAENKESLVNSFCKLARKTRCRIETNERGEVLDIGKVVQDAYASLGRRSSDKECLLIFDNAEKSDHWDTFLPVSLAPEKTKKIRILLTSRDQGWENILRFTKTEDGTNGILKLDTWKPEEALLFVQTYLTIANESDEKHLKDLINELQYFPLALQEAVSYINEQNILSRVSVPDYMDVFRKKVEDLLEFDPAFKEICDDYGKTSYTTWNITLDKILEDKKHAALAITIMRVMSFISPNNISRDMFYDGENADDEVRKAVGLLVRYSMVDGENGKQEVLSVHRLVQKVLRLQLSDIERMRIYSATMALLSNSNVWSGWMDLEKLHKRVDSGPHMRMLRVHLRDDLKDEADEKSQTILKEYLLEVNLLIDELYESGYRIVGNRSAQSDRVVLGYGRESEAWVWLKDIDEALRLAEELYGENSEEVAIILARKGKGLQRGLGKNLIIKSLEIFARQNSERVEVGLAHVDLGYLWAFRNSSLEKGKYHFEQGQAILEKCFSNDDERVVRALASIAFAYWALCEYEEAKTLVQKSLPLLRERGLEIYSPDRQFNRTDEVVPISKLKYLLLTNGDRERRCGSLRINLEDFNEHCTGNGQDNYPLYTLILDEDNTFRKQKKKSTWFDAGVDADSELVGNAELVPTKTNMVEIFQIKDAFDDDDSDPRPLHPTNNSLGSYSCFRWNSYHCYSDIARAPSFHPIYQDSD